MRELLVIESPGKTAKLRALAGRKGQYDFWGCLRLKDGCKAAFANKDGEPVLGEANAG
jgi:hypothetical protein